VLEADNAARVFWESPAVAWKLVSIFFSSACNLATAASAATSMERTASSVVRRAVSTSSWSFWASGAVVSAIAIAEDC